MALRTPWDERFDREGYLYGEQPNDFLTEAAGRLAPGSDILSLAEGEGRNAVFLARQGHRVHAVDASAVGLEKARRLAARHQVDLSTELADLTDYRIESDAYDAIVSIFAHIPPEPRRRLHRQVVAGLKPGGLFILEGYRPQQLEYRTGGPPIEELMMPLGAIVEELDGLELLHAVEVDREIIEGEGHHGLGAVTQIIARKPGQ